MTTIPTSPTTTMTSLKSSDFSSSDFGLNILDASGKSYKQEATENGVYVRVPHNSEYKIEFVNRSWRLKVDVDLEIDGEPAGSYQLDGGQTWAIERLDKHERKLKFVSENTKQAKASKVKDGASKNGLIKATFNQEKPKNEVFACSLIRNQLNFSFGGGGKLEDTPSTFFGGGDGGGGGNLSSSLFSSESNSRGSGFTFGGSSQNEEKPFSFGGGSRNCQQSGSLFLTGSPPENSMSLSAPSRSTTTQKVSSGATVLGGKSEQKFQTVAHLKEYGKTAVLQLRLLAVQEDGDDKMPDIALVEANRLRAKTPPRYEDLRNNLNI